MASSSHRGGAAAYRSREVLSTRSGTYTDEIIQLRIDPMHSELDDHISGLHSQVRMLRNVAREIESEAKYQNDVITQLQMMLIKAQAGVKNNVRKLSKSIILQGTSVMHLVPFALVLSFILFLLSKM
ncbi:Target SNARE coiled-coil domain containing protein [Heracleum sosnowskyi]|uniref:Target SNARE coiled-coil domain containing protein n=1 Tax=Heracleum sosnowskyi TaxID=360622 RepID=A0AAD8H2D0_9APIA|nr:Target SNARE coiled-coil domain containing protein [Heracleum sosnowskyi]